MYKERLDNAWKRVTVDWIDGTMELAIVLWEARQANDSQQGFGKWLEQQGYGEDVISHQNRSALIQMGVPEYREITRKILIDTNRFCWEKIWLYEIKPELINQGISTVLRQQRKTHDATTNLADTTRTTNATDVPNHRPSIAQQPVKRKPPKPTEREMAIAECEALGITATVTFGKAPVLGRMPDDTGEKIYEHINEIYAQCHKLHKLCLYHEQMSDGFKQKIAVEFRSIKTWGEMLAEMVIGHRKFSKIEAPLCHIDVPLRKEGAE